MKTDLLWQEFLKSSDAYQKDKNNVEKYNDFVALYYQLKAQIKNKQEMNLLDSMFNKVK